ncbi:MAG: hypothetical protein ACC742_02100, partial [Thermoanaerobaculales bacterium]
MAKTEESCDGRVSQAVLRSHLLRMTLTTGLFLLGVPLAMAIAFLAPHREASLASPLVMTLLAAAASLWIGFSANRDARARLDRVKRAFAVHGEEQRLLRDYWMVYVVVLLRLEAIVLCGLVAAVWGLGPRTAVWVFLLAGVMIALTWPTMRKTQLLLGRARAIRDG